MKDRTLRQRFLLTVGIILLHIMGRNLPIPWVVADLPAPANYDVHTYLQMTMGNESPATTFFAIGIAPYISASLLLMPVRLFLRKQKTVVSVTAWKRLTAVLALVFAAVQGIFLLTEVTYRDILPLRTEALHAMTLAVLLAGVIVLIVMMEAIQENGIGGASVLIMSNILRGLIRTGVTTVTEGKEDVQTVLLEAGIMMLVIVPVTLLMDRAELRIPMKRIFINNEYAGNSYIAIRLHPSGTMPAMFAMALLSLFMYPVRLLLMVYPDRPVLLTVEECFRLHTYTGLAAFLVLLVIMTFLMAQVTVDPKGIAEDLQNSGDYLTGVRAGKETVSFLQRRLGVASALSALVMCILAGVPMYLYILEDGARPFLNTAVTLMMMTGIIVRILDDVKTEKLLETYEPFF